jgi:hypothetical protein
MSISESAQVASRAGSADRSRGLVALILVLALGLVLLVALLASPTGGLPAHHVAGVAPRIAR